MTPEHLTDKVARAIFDAAPFRDEAGPFEVQSRQYQDITRLYASAAIRVVLEEVASPKFLRPLVEKQAMGEWDDETIDEDVATFAAALTALMPKEPT